MCNQANTYHTSLSQFEYSICLVFRQFLWAIHGPVCCYTGRLPDPIKTEKLHRILYVVSWSCYVCVLSYCRFVF